MSAEPLADPHLTRRRFVASAAAGVGALAIAPRLPAQEAAPVARPNILWIVSEDNIPLIGAYGDKLARTPTLDGLAQQGVLFRHCFSNAPVCAPSRFCLISGMYATSCGPAHHMRAQGRLPQGFRGFPAFLRDAGYYCTNNAKTDYNAPINMKDTWDQSSRTAHWRNRPGVPGAGAGADKPFFAVFNHEVTHESSLFPGNSGRGGDVPTRTDPARVALPAYHPDTPEFRRDWANYYDQMAKLDGQVARLLRQLEDDGLAEDTIVFYYGDNGGVLPRSKRFPYDSGTHVPLIVRFPKKWQHLAPAPPGGRIDAPVTFVDFAPTVLGLAGIEVPKLMQGHAFAGPKALPQQYAFCFRNRMDERYDMVRTVRDTRYRYMRNYMPHVIYGQHVEYMFQMASMRQWEKLYKQGKLQPPQTYFWQDKPEEELYDLETDPWEVKNLAGSAEHQDILKRLRAANEEHLLRIRDNGFIPEGSDLEGYEQTRDPRKYPLEEIIQVAHTATRRDPANLPKLVAWLSNEHECFRWWAALGCIMLRDKAAPAGEALSKTLADVSGSVRVAAAEALCHIGANDKALAVLQECLASHANPRVRLQAANALQNLGDKARPALPALEKALTDQDDYVKRAVKHTVSVLKGEYGKEA